MSMKQPRFILALGLAAALALVAPVAQTQVDAQAQAAAPKVTAPKEEWGHNIGDDYFLANYDQLVAYWKKLDKESPRMVYQEIGQTAMKRPHPMAIVSSPENLAKLDHYKNISRQLSLAEGRTDEAARKLAKEGKSIVWIDGGLHASEVLGAQQLMEMV